MTRKSSRKSSVRSRKIERKYPTKSKGGKNSFNKYFDKVFVINLKKGGEKRYNTIIKRLIDKELKYEVFDAVDGRADKKDYNKKKRELESIYKLKISRTLNPPAASLVIGTIEILKMIVRNRWSHVLIFEDDIIPVKNFHKKFDEGIEELETHMPDWDLLYLGCGNQCGSRGVSYDQTYKTTHKTSLSIVDEEIYDWYVGNKNDLRAPCDEDYCEPISKNLSGVVTPGGTWGYAYSYKGAKKMLKYIDGRVRDHIDQMLMKGVKKGLFNVAAFDPPLCNHQAGAFRADSSIPWSF